MIPIRKHLPWLKPSSRFLSFFIQGGLILASLLCTQNLISQNQNNIWYFGFNCGVDFNSGSPVALTNGQLWTGEGSSSISNSQGNLLFYTSGVVVYNRMHTLMPNGSGLHGASSSTHSAIIVPHPGDTNLFYIFTTTDYAQSNGLKYSMVNMTLDGGKGDVTLKNIPLATPVCEKIAVTNHANGTDIWIIAHDWGTNNFFSYLLTPGGLNPSPVVSSAGIVTVGGGGTNNGNNSVGQMKVSPDRTKIAVGIFGMRLYEIYQFDNASGIISNPITIPNPESTTTYWAYGVEFSPNSKFLYVKHESGNIFQYDISSYNVSSILNSKVLVGFVNGSYPGEPTGALQLGPDNKIYVAKTSMSYLARINFPNTAGTACGVQDNAVNLAGKNCNLGLPTLIPNSFNNYIIASGCEGDSMHFHLFSYAASITGYSWNFGDSLSLNNTSTLPDPAHFYSGPGTYTVSLTITYLNGSSQTFSYIAVVTAAPALLSVDTVSICAGDTASLAIQPGFQQIIWSTGATTSSISVHPDSSMYYSVQAFSGNCPVTDSVLVWVTKVTTPDLGSDTVLCSIGDSIHLFVDTLYSGYLWSTGDTTHQITVNNTGIYWITVSQAQCSASYSVTVYSQEAPTLAADTSVCEGESVTFSAQVNASQYLWNTGDTTEWITANTNGVYIVSVSLGNCLLSDTAVLMVKPKPFAFLGNDTLVCPHRPFVLTASHNGDHIIWNSGDSSNSLIITDPGTYWVMVIKEGCTNMDTLTIDTLADYDPVIPNVITPNNDGKNDLFPMIDIILPDYSLDIFNRWGQLIFSSRNTETNWDGSMHEQRVSQGVYYYLIEYRTQCRSAGHLQRTGVVSVLR